MINTPMFGIPPSVWWPYVLKCISSIVGGMAFVAAGAYVAPTYKKKVVVVLFVLISLVFGFDIYLVLKDHLWGKAIVFACMIVGAGYMTYENFKYDC